MSTTIDQKVVEMRFDNKHFEANVSNTMSTLDKLKKSLKLTDAAKGFENISNSAKKVNLNPMSNAVQTVSAKFSAMEVMAVTALANITNSAVNAGKRIVSALTIDPIKTGFSEYETKINAVQTIMSNTASKGTTMEDVTKTLNELNTYADKTIYNFAEMTRNIGTFTAAGVGLEESASAIQGNTSAPLSDAKLIACFVSKTIATVPSNGAYTLPSAGLIAKPLPNISSAKVGSLIAELSTTSPFNGAPITSTFSFVFFLKKSNISYLLFHPTTDSSYIDSQINQLII